MFFVESYCNLKLYGTTIVDNMLIGIIRYDLIRYNNYFLEFFSKPEQR